MSVCADVAFDRVMCSAVRRRMLVKGTTSSLTGVPVPCAWSPSRSAMLGTGEGFIGAAGPDGPPAVISDSTSPRVIRPPRPVPVTADGSMPCSLSSLRTTGDSTSPAPVVDAPSAVGAVTGGRGAGCAGCAGCAGGAGCAAGCAAGATESSLGSSCNGAAEPASTGAVPDPASPPATDPSPPMTARVTPTSTVSPSSTRMEVSTPAAGDGTSESTLSVDTSNRGSSLATVSPTAFSHLVMVPSVTVSPSWGIVTSGKVQPSSGQGQHRLAERLRQGRVRLDELGDLVGGRLPVDGQVSRAELLGHPRPDHVDPENPPGCPIGSAFGHDLHHPLGIADDAGPAVAAEGILLDDHVVAGLTGGGLGQPGEGHLGMAVDGPRDPLVGDRHHRFAQDALDHHDRLGEADVGQLRRGDDVAYRPDTVRTGPHRHVGDDELPVVHCHPGALGAEPLGAGAATDGDDHGIHGELLAVPV